MTFINKVFNASVLDFFEKKKDFFPMLFGTVLKNSKED